MAKAAGYILKASEVKLEGSLCLDVTQNGAGRPRPAGTALVTPQALIAENHPEFAVIEITCSCGTKLLLRCEYADASSAADPKSQEPE